MNNNVIFGSSMMCADYKDLRQEVTNLVDSGIDFFHCDLMDGNFVPNIAMGINDIKAIREITNKFIDCHLMIEIVFAKVDWVINAGVDLVYIHPESERYTGKTLAYIKEKGILAGIAISPDTSVCSIKEVLNICDYVLVMTVNPGFASQKFIESMKSKIYELILLKEKYSYKLIVDGACSKERIKEFSQLGCDGFVLGTSTLFNKEKLYVDVINDLKRV